MGLARTDTSSPQPRTSPSQRPAYSVSPNTLSPDVSHTHQTGPDHPSPLGSPPLTYPPKPPQNPPDKVPSPPRPALWLPPRHLNPPLPTRSAPLTPSYRNFREHSSLTLQRDSQPESATWARAMEARASACPWCLVQYLAHRRGSVTTD